MIALMRARRGALVCLLLSLAGIALCVYLGFVHIALLRGEFVGGAVCGGAGSIFNCHAVTAGPLGTVLGIPLWVWGLIGYLATLNLASIAWLFPDWSSKALTLLTSLSLLFVAIDLCLLVTMVSRIHYLCLLCLMTYLVNLLLVFFGKWALAQPWGQIARQTAPALRAFVPSTQRPVAWLFFGVMVLGVCGSVSLHAATTFVVQGSHGVIRKQLQEFIAREQRVQLDVSGDPSVGSSNAPLEMVEFSDFFCPVCQRAAQFNAIILANHRQDLRFVFKHFPLDSSCNEAIQHTVHPGACTVAAASECAHLQGKFWPFHDVIFEKGHGYNIGLLEQDARQLGLDVARFQSCMASGEGLSAVKRDIAEAQKLRVASTPTYVVNGLRIGGVMTPSMFEELVKTLRENQP